MEEITHNKLVSDGRIWIAHVQYKGKWTPTFDPTTSHLKHLRIRSQMQFIFENAKKIRKLVSGED